MEGRKEGETRQGGRESETKGGPTCRARYGTARWGEDHTGRAARKRRRTARTAPARQNIGGTMEVWGAKRHDHK